MPEFKSHARALYEEAEEYIELYETLGLGSVALYAIIEREYDHLDSLFDLEGEKDPHQLNKDPADIVYEGYKEISEKLYPLFEVSSEVVKE